MTTRCPTRARHWFIVWGHVGLRAPACLYCGAPNPRPLTDNEWAELIWYREDRGRPITEAIEKLIQAREPA